MNFDNSQVNPETDVRQQMTSFYQSPMNAYGSSIVQLTNPENEIVKMELVFRGKMIDAQGNVKDIGHSVMNEEGILAVTGTVQSIVNQVTILSNLDKHNVKNIMSFFIYTIVKDLMLNETRYSIGKIEKNVEIDVPIRYSDGTIQYMKKNMVVIYHDRAARDKVLQIALSTAFICVKRGFEGDDKRFWKGTQHENIVKMEGGGQSTKGIGSFLNFWKK